MKIENLTPAERVASWLRRKDKLRPGRIWIFAPLLAIAGFVVVVLVLRLLGFPIYR